MLYRLLTLVVVLAIVVVPTAVQAEKKEKGTAEGTVVKAADGKLTIQGKDNKEHTCNVAKDATITCDGKECKLADLKPGTRVRVTLAKNMATKVEAKTK